MTPTPISESESVLTCRMDTLSRALRAALKIAGKKELAYVRLARIGVDRLAVSAVNEKATFSTTLHANFMYWNEERDDAIDITKAVAASLAGFEIKMPNGLDSDPLVSLRIGEEALRLRDETGLFPIARGRNEYREADPVLPGDHEDALSRTAVWSGSPFVIPPDQLVTAAAVAKTLDRPVHLMQRLVRDAAVRWYVVGPDWRLSMSTLPDKEATVVEAEAAKDATKDDAGTGEKTTPTPDVKVVAAKQSEFAPA
ncbi:hypothetical protein [Corynebacterium sp. CCUG 51687]|uniref:hypothetical protein n=1 Tax=Corynebacterium sp. CCUG 51687 TaxID=2823897 RepID=UPI002109BFC0|nr:hypothetical protein [Corynebacterium sp. CCUG 51687]MCQ4611873.1 hypothetical protein [Corynebacterium sp. CCUG 51687]